MKKIVLIFALILMSFDVLCMEEPGAQEKKEFFKMFKALTKELQQKIQSLMLQDTITFLGLQPRTLDGHKTGIYGLAIKDNKIVTGDSGGIVKVWNINTGACLLTIKKHDRAIFSLAITGDKVVTAGNDNIAKIWDINTGEDLLFLPVEAERGIDSVAISNDNLSSEFISLEKLLARVA